MASIYQVTWKWTGFPGAPGYTNLFFDATVDSGANALAAVTKSRLLFDGVKGGLMSNTHIGVNTDVKVLEDTTGALVNIWAISGVTEVVGAGGGNYAAANGMVIDWLTTTIHAGKRMQGRTFLVPTNVFDAFSGDGSPASAFVTTVATAAEAMRNAAGPTFGIWGRPRKADPDATPPKPFVPGLWGPAISSRVPDKAAVLRSRRD